MMTLFFSSLLIAAGQTAAVLLYLLYRQPDDLPEHRGRLCYAALFCLLLCISQAALNHHVSRSGMGSLPTLPFLALGWILYALFVWLWSQAQWEICCFVAFVLLLADNCIWPLIGGLSRALWGANYLYEGMFIKRLPFILVLWVLECSLVGVIRRLMPAIHKIYLSVYDAVLAAAIVVPFLYIRAVAGQSITQNNKTVQITMTVCTLVAVLTLAARVGEASGQYEKLREERMHTVLRQQQALFDQKLQNADTVNRKYHDMKNFLLFLRSEGGGGELTASIDQLMESIEPYGTNISTGNSILDVILGEKLALCATKEITCVPYIDGTLLSFVRPLDLCTLIGNAMDNAIESCARIPEKERRSIRLHAARHGEAVLLTVRNTFSERPAVENGLPRTTKADTTSHGYGLRNMRYLAGNYNGTLVCRIEGEEFVLSILLEQPAFWE